MNIPPEAKILIVDIETAPMLAYLYGMYDQSIGVEQVVAHKYILSIACKWAHEDTIYYTDQRNRLDLEDDKPILEWLMPFFEEANIVVGQNSERFDIRTINARIEYHQMKRYSDFRQQDTKKIAKKNFDLPSYSLAYMGEYFQLKNRKTTHTKFSGFSLWREIVLNKNQEAFAEMEVYNKQDVLTTEELWKRLVKWDDKVSYSVYSEDAMPKCDCGCLDLRKNGFRWKNKGKYQRYSCFDCGKPVIGKDNLLTKLKKSEILV